MSKISITEQGENFISGVYHLDIAATITEYLNGEFLYLCHYVRAKVRNWLIQQGGDARVEIGGGSFKFETQLMEGLDFDLTEGRQGVYSMLSDSAREALLAQVDSDRSTDLYGLGDAIWVRIALLRRLQSKGISEIPVEFYGYKKVDYD